MVVSTGPAGQVLAAPRAGAPGGGQAEHVSLGGREAPEWLHGAPLTRFDVLGFFGAFTAHPDDGRQCAGISAPAACLLAGGGGVVLCAGAFGAPKVLWQSGIGTCDQLRLCAGQPMAMTTMVDDKGFIDLPVGCNLMG